MTAFDPVFLPEGRGLNRKVSATLLRHVDLCPRSGFLYQLHKGEAHTPEMERGSAFHAARERATAACMEQGEAVVPPELAKAILDETLRDYHVPIREQDRLREMVYRWSTETAIDPAAVIANETLFHLEVGGWQVRCKIDFAEAIGDGSVVAVEDHKTSLSLTSYEDIARRRPDGSLSAKNMQLVLYGLCLVFGVPVRVEECPSCKHTFTTGPNPELFPPCETCGKLGGSGRVEIPEPFPVAARAQELKLAFVYPGIEDAEGRMARREVTLTRSELEEYRASLEALVARVERSEQTGDWPAQTSDDGCSICPARPECPIPVAVRDHRGTVNSPQEASEAAERLAWDKDDQAARQKELRLWSKVNGPIRFGADRVMEFGFQEAERITDKDAMWAALERTRLYGEPFERAEFVKRVTSTPFRVRTLSGAELDQEQATKEGSNE